METTEHNTPQEADIMALRYVGMYPDGHWEVRTSQGIGTCPNLRHLNHLPGLFEIAVQAKEQAGEWIVLPLRRCAAPVG